MTNTAHNGIKDQVIAGLLQFGESTVTELASLLDLDRKAVRDSMTRLVKTGMAIEVDKKEVPGTSPQSVYALTDEGAGIVPMPEPIAEVAAEVADVAPEVAPEPQPETAPESQFVPYNRTRRDRAYRVYRSESGMFVLTLFEAFRDWVDDESEASVLECQPGIFKGIWVHQSEYHNQEIADQTGQAWINSGVWVEPEPQPAPEIPEIPEIPESWGVPKLDTLNWAQSEIIRQDAMAALKGYALSLGYEAGVPANASSRIMSLCGSHATEAEARHAVFSDLLPEIKLEILTDYDHRVSRAKQGEVSASDHEIFAQGLHSPLQDGLDSINRAIGIRVQQSPDPILRALIAARDAVQRVINEV